MKLGLIHIRYVHRPLIVVGDLSPGEEFICHLRLLKENCRTEWFYYQTEPKLNFRINLKLKYL